jgi:predicted dehydrogenase
MKKMNAAVLGVGTMGGTHVEAALESPYIDKVYGFEPDPERCKERCGKYNIIPADLNTILADPSIGFVSIASPNETHVELAEKCLRAGKAVVLEKPMGCSLAEAKHLCDVEKETGGFLQVGFELHYSKMYQIVKDWIKADLIGTPVNNQCRYYCCEFHKKNTWRSKSTGSFLIGEKLSHYLDLQRWYFDAAPESVYSLSSAKVVPYFNHRDNHQIMTRYPDGRVAVLNFIMYIAESHLAKDPLQSGLEVDDGHFLQYHICGTKGAIETDVFKHRIRRWEFSDKPEYMDSNIVEEINFDPRTEGLVYYHNVHGQNLRVIELAATGQKSEMTAREAYDTMKLCFAAELSEDTGELIKFDDPRIC